MATLFIILIILFVSTYSYLKQAQFGKKPNGKRLERIKKSPNFKDGQFQNINFTPTLAENYSMLGVMINHLFHKYPRKKPIDDLPNIKTNLHNLKPNEDVMIWFGHGSYFIQLDGKRFLIDPVFSGNASPIPGSIKAFKGSDIYDVSDLPQIDYLFISHDHYDHLDYKTIINLKPKVKHVICGLGVGAHFEHWNYPKEIITERDWYDTIALGPKFEVTLEPARHFSGRGFIRNKTLWTAFVLQTPSMKLFLGGDSGYDTHFKTIGDKHGPFDLVILENGQYNVAWPYIHNLPGQPLQAAVDLKAKRLFTGHHSKFTLANHPWDEPLIRLVELNKDYNIPLITPKIGEVVSLKDTNQTFTQWWVGVE